MPELEFSGWINNKQEFFSKIDIFCQPSHFEPFGLTIIEAMSYGKAVISTKCDGPVEILNTNKKNGILNNKTFMFTGKLQGISRAEAKSLIENNSGTIISNVSKKLDYLITGEKPTKRKIEAAKTLKIKILKQSEWLKLLNKTS